MLHLSLETSWVSVREREAAASAACAARVTFSWLREQPSLQGRWSFRRIIQEAGGKVCIRLTKLMQRWGGVFPLELLINCICCSSQCFTDLSMWLVNSNSDFQFVSFTIKHKLCASCIYSFYVFCTVLYLTDQYMKYNILFRICCSAQKLLFDGDVTPCIKKLVMCIHLFYNKWPNSVRSMLAQSGRAVILNFTTTHTQTPLMTKPSLQ